jgi:hypothetical protein
MLRLAAAVGLTLALLLPSSIPASAKPPKHRTACQRLAGTDHAPAKSVKLVRHLNRDRGSDLLGCVLPAGRVRTIASSEHYDTADFRYHVVSVAGRFVLLSLAGGNQYAYNESASVWDLGSGRSYTIARLCSQTGGGDCATGGSTTASAAFLTTGGRAVAAILPAPDAHPSPTGPVTIAGFAPGGARRDLDGGSLAEIPPPSLALRGNLASWTHDGAPRSADLTSG